MATFSPNPENIDFIVATPYSSNIGLDQTGALKPRLSMPSRLSIDCAIALWRYAPNAQIIIPGETGYGDDYRNTTDLMVERALTAKVPVPIDHLVGLHELADGTPLNNTHLQMEAVGGFLSSKHQLGAQVVAVAMNFHRARVTRAMIKQGGFEADMAVAEQMVARESITGYEGYIPHLDKLGRLEPLLNVLSMSQPGVQLLNHLTKTRGGRLADLHTYGEGGVIIELGTTRDKQEELERQRDDLLPAIQAAT